MTPPATCRANTTASDGLVRAALGRALLLWAFLLLVTVGAAAASAHPLDALSAEEINTAMHVLRAAGHADMATRFPLITLDEPDKSAVLAWRPGEPFARKAFVIARRDRPVYEGVIDLASSLLERWQSVPNAQPAL